MDKRKNIIIGILVAVAVIIVVAGCIYWVMQSQDVDQNNNNENNQEPNNSQDNNNISSGKIDDTKDIVYEQIVAQHENGGDVYNVSLPVININNEEIKALNSKIVEDSNGFYYTKFEYYTYNNILSVYIYFGYSAGDGPYVTYNIDTNTNKVITDNNDLMSNLDVDIVKYMQKQDVAINKYFESYWAQKYDNKSYKQINPQGYDVAKKYTKSEENNSIKNHMYIDNSADIYVIASVYENAGSEPPTYDRVIKVCNVLDVLNSKDIVKQTDEFYLNLVNKLPMQINMINKSFTDITQLTDDQRLAIILAYNLRNQYSQWETKETGIVLKEYNIDNMADINTLDNIKKSELELFGKQVIKEYKIKGALKVYSDNMNPGLEQICYSDKIKYTTNYEPCYLKKYEYNNRMYTPITIFEKVETKGNLCDVYVKQAYSVENGYVALDLYQQHGNRIMDYTTNKVIYSNHNYCLDEDKGQMTNTVRTDLDNLYNEYKGQMSTYKYTFKIENGNYYLQGVAITPVSQNISKNFGENLYYVKDNSTSFIRWEIYQDYGDWKTAYYVMNNKLYHYDMTTLKSTLIADSVISIEYEDQKIEVLVNENSKTYNTEKDILGILNYVTYFSL